MNAWKPMLAGILLVATAAGLLAADLQPSPSRDQIKTAFLAANAAQPQTDMPSMERIKTAFLAAAAIDERGAVKCRAAVGQDFANQKTQARRSTKGSRHRRRSV